MGDTPQTPLLKAVDNTIFTSIQDNVTAIMDLWNLVNQAPVPSLIGNGNTSSTQLSYSEAYKGQLIEILRKYYLLAQNITTYIPHVGVANGVSYANYAKIGAKLIPNTKDIAATVLGLSDLRVELGTTKGVAQSQLTLKQDAYATLQKAYDDAKAKSDQQMWLGVISIFVAEVALALAIAGAVFALPAAAAGAAAGAAFAGAAIAAASGVVGTIGSAIGIGVSFAEKATYALYMTKLALDGMGKEIDAVKVVITQLDKIGDKQRDMTESLKKLSTYAFQFQVDLGALEISSSPWNEAQKKEVIDGWTQISATLKTALNNIRSA